jgi:acetyl-CoA carboxylase alpha subunit
MTPCNVAGRFRHGEPLILFCNTPGALPGAVFEQN